MDIKIKLLARAIGISIFLLIGTIGIDIPSVSAVDFTPPSDNKAPRQGSGGSSRTHFTPSSAPTEESRPSSRTNFTAPPSRIDATPATSFILPADLIVPAKGRPLNSQTSN
ncbi:hypothetical protein IQ249_02870 [Lusitaniella coriacea LEGE 07157]|uniref:Uncharacterized protein n=1 Tax=Lusitaniella coriacea LEGE 07157 TaxID=945747 RepID=A0A8J7DU24_9CYAN|nr:hypothetical protein [Lusitaniella coriacea]MBE9114831.1 hypothetical protein [Lusitaniella coriacea LEGE 07157]